MNRMTTRTVTFRHPFALEGLEDWQPAGSYVIETEEELLLEISFPVWRRLHTAIRLPWRAGGPMAEQIATVDPAAIEAALAADAATG
jgi:hypothetical protein